MYTSSVCRSVTIQHNFQILVELMYMGPRYHVYLFQKLFTGTPIPPSLYIKNNLPDTSATEVCMLPHSSQDRHGSWFIYQNVMMP